MTLPSNLFEPGQLWHRAMAVVLFPVALWRMSESWSHDGSVWLAVVSGIAAFVFFALSIPPFYSAWLRFGERLNGLVMTVIFGAIYLLFLPFLLIFVVPKNRLRTRKADECETFWEEQTDRNDEIEEMMRMG